MEVVKDVEPWLGVRNCAGVNYNNKSVFFSVYTLLSSTKSLFYLYFYKRNLNWTIIQTLRAKDSLCESSWINIAQCIIILMKRDSKKLDLEEIF